MSTHVIGFQSFLSVFASFCIGQISHQLHKGLQPKEMVDTVDTSKTKTFI